MNIDTTNGTLTVCQTVIPSTLTLQEFLASAMCQPHTKVLENGPFVTYKMESICDNHKYISTLYFQSGLLDSISLYVSDSSPATGWGSWSEAEEQKRLQSLVDLLTQQGIANGQRFAWGIVSASYDQRSGDSSITIRHTRP
ncbi:hypothetical protein [Paraburkholderia strydomiana]|uniref:hypothetical protein n=1 Tax=Paraburkholderia strydomiana TaxID=1245417 RepID=UPI001BEC441E|nr:hypothetical protein [Paraburkholderia strydomiana]